MFYYFVYHIWITINNRTHFFFFFHLVQEVQTPLAITHVHKTWVTVSLEVLHIRQTTSTGTPCLDKLSIASKELLNDHQRKSKTFSPLHLFYSIHASITFFFFFFLFFFFFFCGGLFAFSLFVYFYLFILLILLTGKLLSTILFVV